MEGVGVCGCGCEQYVGVYVGGGGRYYYGWW